MPYTIDIIAFSKKLPPWIEEGITHYLKSLPKAYTIKRIQKGPVVHKDPHHVKKQEALLITPLFDQEHTLIALDERGTQMNTHAFHKMLYRTFDEQKPPRFIIGGHHGLHPSIRDQSDQVYALSSLNPSPCHGTTDLNRTALPCHCHTTEPSIPSRINAIYSLTFYAIHS